MTAGSKVMYPVRGYRRKGIVRIMGSFLPNGTSTPTLPALQKQSTTGTTLTGVPGISSMTWQSTGKWRIVFDKTYIQLLAANMTPIVNGNAAVALQLAAVDLGGSTVTGFASVDILNNPAGTPTDIAANAGSIIYFDFAFNESDTV